MTKRKADMVRIAEALGIAPLPGQTASELADRCEERAAELRELAEAREVEAELDAEELGPEARRQKREHESLRATVGATTAREAEPAPAAKAAESKPKRERKSSRKARSEAEA